MPTAAKPNTDENVIIIDARNLSPRGGGRGAKAPIGDYLLEVVSMKNVAIANGKNKGQRQVAIVTRIVGTPDEPEARACTGDSVYANAGIGENSVWFLRNIIDDMLGADITGTSTSLRLDDKVGKRFGATLVPGDEFVNKQDEMDWRSEIKNTFPASKFVGASSGGNAPAAAEEEADEAPAPKPAKAAPKAAAAAAAEAVNEPGGEDEDIEELPVQSL